MKSSQIVRAIFVFFSCGVVTSFTARGARLSSLHYRFIEGNTNVYHVEVEQRAENGREILAGNIFVTATNNASNVFRLDFRGNLLPRREATGARFFSPAMAPRWPMNVRFDGSNELQVDERGHVLGAAGDHALPTPLGQLMETLVEDFSIDLNSRGEIVDETFVLDDPLNSGPADVFLVGPQFGNIYYGPRSAVALVRVKRRMKFDVTASSDDIVTIRKQLQLESLLQTGPEPRVIASGKGTLVFDLKKGLLRKIDFESEATVSTHTTNRKFTTGLHCHLLEGGELEAALNPPAPAPEVRHALSEEEIQKIMIDLKSDDASTRREAMRRLNSGMPKEISSDLLDAVAGLLSESDSFTRQQAATFFADNSGKDQVPVLVKLLKDSNFSVRQSAVRALGRLKDVRAAAPLAELIASGQPEAHDAGDALIKIGADAESAALQLLDEKNLETRRRACEILAQIGTQKSIEPLKNVMLSPDQSVSHAAVEAVRAIQARQ
jgi:hypothetical protein